MQEIKLTATGIVPDFHRIPFYFRFALKLLQKPILLTKLEIKSRIQLEKEKIFSRIFFLRFFPIEL